MTSMIMTTRAWCCMSQWVPWHFFAQASTSHVYKRLQPRIRQALMGYPNALKEQLCIKNEHQGKCIHLRKNVFLWIFLKVPSLQHTSTIFFSIFWCFFLDSQCGSLWFVASLVGQASSSPWSTSHASTSMARRPWRKWRGRSTPEVPFSLVGEGGLRLILGGLSWKVSQMYLKGDNLIT